MSSCASPFAYIVDLDSPKLNIMDSSEGILVQSWRLKQGLQNHFGSKEPLGGFRFRFCLLFNRFTTREVELEDALGGQQGLGFTHMYTRMARVTDPTQVSPVPPSLAVNS